MSDYQYMPDSLKYKNLAYGLENMENSSFFPSTLHTDSKLTYYNFRYLFQRAISVFEWRFPKSLETNYFLYTLYKRGYGFVFKTKKYGTIFNHGGLSGYNIYYQPAYAVVANPLLNVKNGENPNYYSKMRIGEDCAIIRLTPDYCGIVDICKYYAEILSIASSSLVTNFFNTKLAYIFGATNKNIAETLKGIYDKIASGEPAVFIDKKLFDENGNISANMFNSAVKNIYIGSELIQDIRSVINDFDSMVGIPNSNYTKKERMIKDEANMNNFETKALCYLWLDTLRKDIEESNKMFPEFAFNVDFRKEVINNAKSSDDYSVNSVQS